MPVRFRFTVFINALVMFAVASSLAWAQPRAIGPVLQIQTSPLDFDTVHCGTTKCRQVVFLNTGDTMLAVRSSAAVLAPFSGALEAANIPPGQSRAYTLCYQAATNARRDSQRVFFRADSRVSVSLAMLIDVSASMRSPFGSGTRIQAAHDAADSLINDLVMAGTIQDEAAIYSFETSTTQLQGFTSNRAALLAALPTAANGAQTCVYDALIRTIADVRTRPNPPIVVVLTDGANTCAGSGTTLQNVIAAARLGPAPVRIFTIDIGQAAVTEMQQLADSTGGRYQSAADPAALTAAFRSIVTLLSQNQQFSIRLDAETVAPQFTLSANEIDFGSVMVGASRCVSVTVGNPGNAPLELSAIGLNPPYSIQNAPASQIQPGGIATMDLCFTPGARGFAQATVTLRNSSCATPLPTLQLRGVGMTVSSSVLGPILQIAPKPLDFDTTFCMTTKCLTLSYANVGDTSLTVRGVQALPPPFSGNIPVPFELTPGQSRSFQICYYPPDAPRLDTATVSVNADTRVSMSIGLLFDVSGSMTLAISGSDATQRIAAAKNAGMDFVTSLIDTLDVRDEAAVMSFSNAFSIQQGFTTDKTALTNTINAFTASGGTRLYSSIVDACTSLATRANRKVLIVLTDGEDNQSTHTAAQAIAAAQAAGITVFCIGIGEANGAVLTNIATATSGRFFSASTTTDLVAVYRQIASLLGQNSTTSFMLRGRGVRPEIQTVLSAQFDSTMVGETRCTNLIIGNTGEAPLIVQSAATSNPMFSFQTPTPLAIQPGSSASVQVCFAPTRLRVLGDTLRLGYNGCGLRTQEVLLQGIGYDSVTIALLGTVVAKPGNDAVFPIRLLKRIPADYEVNSYSLALRYNKTLLAANRTGIGAPVAPVFLDNTLSRPLAFTGFTETFDGSTAVLGMSFSGLLENPIADSLLLNVRLLALLGDARETDVTIAAIQLADGNPRVGLLHPARFRIDSLCYIEQRLVDARGRMGMLKQNTPNPFHTSTRLSYTIVAECKTRLSVLDTYGREVRLLHDAFLPPGDYDALFDATDLPAGVYFSRLQCDDGIDTQKMLLVK